MLARPRPHRTRVALLITSSSPPRSRCGPLRHAGYGRPISHAHRRNSRTDRGRLVPQLLGWGEPVSQLLGRSLQKARILKASSHQNAGFSTWVFINFPGAIPRTLTAGASAPVLGPKPWSPWTFQPWSHGNICWQYSIGSCMSSFFATFASMWTGIIT